MIQPGLRFFVNYFLFPKLGKMHYARSQNILLVIIQFNTGGVANGISKNKIENFIVKMRQPQQNIGLKTESLKNVQNIFLMLSNIYTAENTFDKNYNSFLTE